MNNSGTSREEDTKESSTEEDTLVEYEEVGWVYPQQRRGHQRVLCRRGNLGRRCRGRIFLQWSQSPQEIRDPRGDCTIKSGDTSKKAEKLPISQN